MAEALTIESEEIALQQYCEFNSSQIMVSGDIYWPVPPSNWSLGGDQVHVWAAHLDLLPEALGGFRSILSKEELRRANRFRFETYRERFIAARGILRTLLAPYLKCAPDKLDFSYGPKGKPALADEFSGSGLFFNLAHSEELALIAITRLSPIGIDIEKIRPMSDLDELVERFFSVRESALFQKLPDEQKNPAFFNLWTRKEAWLKATGEGIGDLLNRVEVTFLPGEHAQFLSLPQNSGSISDWTLRPLEPSNSFVGAVALPNLQFSISSFQFSITRFP